MLEDDVELPWETGQRRDDPTADMANMIPGAPYSPSHAADVPEPVEEAGPGQDEAQAGQGMQPVAETADEIEVVEAPAAPDPLAGAEERIAALVRERTTAWARPLCLDDLIDLFPGADPDALGVRVAGMVHPGGAYADIRAAATPSGAIYLFSLDSMTPADAVAKAEADDICRAIAGRVRQESQEFARLTTVESLYGVVPQANPGRVQDALAAMRADPAYADIKEAGARFLYSDRYVTDAYATILKRAAANDPIALIAETVRDDSRIYPRPTNLASFETPVYNINAARLDEFADELLSRPEYADIKELRASTGARYLYSTRHLDADQVQAIVEWEEVGKYQYP